MWTLIDKLPEYTTHIGGRRFVNLILADKDGRVWPGDYTEGKFMVLGVEHHHITHWMRYPEPPDNNQNNRTQKAAASDQGVRRLRNE